MANWNKFLAQALTDSITKRELSLFDRFCQIIDDHFYNQKATTVKSLHKDNNHQKGTLFEELSLELLRKQIPLGKYQFNLAEVWRYSELPDDVLRRLGFVKANGEVNRRDYGIDLVGRTANDEWVAVQCKYIKKPLKPVKVNGYVKRWVVEWEKLSTFYGLCARTGPWSCIVVMTNCAGVNRQGRKGKIREATIAHDTLDGIERHSWELLCGYSGHKLSDMVVDESEKVVPTEEVKLDEVRQKRLAWLDRLQ